MSLSEPPLTSEAENRETECCIKEKRYRLCFTAEGNAQLRPAVVCVIVGGTDGAWEEVGFE
jgi:hypothetical protein